MVLLGWPPPHFSQSPLTTGKLPRKASPCPGEVPPTLELVLSSLEHVLPQVGAGVPSCSGPSGECMCSISAPCASGEHGSSGCLTERTPPYWQLQPLLQAWAWAEDKVLHRAQDGDIGNRQELAAAQGDPSVPLLACMHSGSPCLHQVLRASKGHIRGKRGVQHAPTHPWGRGGSLATRCVPAFTSALGQAATWGQLSPSASWCAAKPRVAGREMAFRKPGWVSNSPQAQEGQDTWERRGAPSTGSLQETPGWSQRGVVAGCPSRAPLRSRHCGGSKAVNQGNSINS